MLIQDQFDIIQDLQMSPIPKTSFLVGTIFCRFLQQAGSSQCSDQKVLQHQINENLAEDFLRMSMLMKEDISNSAFQLQGLVGTHNEVV